MNYYAIRNWGAYIVSYWEHLPNGTQVWPLGCNASIMRLIFEQED